MKTLFSMIVLFAFIALSGCSEKTQAPVAPKENSSIESPASLSKSIIQKSRVWHYSIKLMNLGVKTKILGQEIWTRLIMEDRFETPTPNPLLTGKVINTVNISKDLTTGKAIIWGTLIVTPEANAGGDKWEIAYSGKLESTGATTAKAKVNGVGRGAGGDINGMMITTDFLMYYDFSSAGITWEGAGNVYLTPGIPFLL